jgi:sec-independent protein translocase protein TatB
MFDLAWSEIFVIGLVAVLILGPKELPKAMRSVAQFMKKARKLAGEFQNHWNDAMRESELDEVKKTVQKIVTTDVGGEVEKFIDPSGEFARELDDTVTKTRAEIESATRLDPPAVPVTAPSAPAATAPAAPAPPASSAAA